MLQFLLSRIMDANGLEISPTEGALPLKSACHSFTMPYVLPEYLKCAVSDLNHTDVLKQTFHTSILHEMRALAHTVHILEGIAEQNQVSRRSLAKGVHNRHVPYELSIKVMNEEILKLTNETMLYVNKLYQLEEREAALNFRLGLMRFSKTFN